MQGQERRAAEESVVFQAGQSGAQPAVSQMLPSNGYVSLDAAGHGLRRACATLSQCAYNPVHETVRALKYGAANLVEVLTAEAR